MKEEGEEEGEWEEGEEEEEEDLYEGAHGLLGAEGGLDSPQEVVSLEDQDHLPGGQGGENISKSDPNISRKYIQ